MTRLSFSALVLALGTSAATPQQKDNAPTFIKAVERGM
jgi:hypothetical protein